jgi:hypothetical protein
MRPTLIRVIGATALLILLGVSTGCLPGQSSQPTASEESFDPQNFPEPTRITNQYYPLSPGAKFVLEGNRKNIPLRVEVMVTRDTKVINSIKTVAVNEKIFEARQLIEDTIDWFAQDKSGNVWYLGQYATDYERGQQKGHEGSWEAGVNGAKPGVVMYASPQIGRAYRQEFAPKIAEDMAKVVKLNDSLCVPLKCFQGNVLVTEEWTSLDKTEVVRKHYAPGVGLIRSQTIKGEPEKIELVSIQTAG